MRDRATQLVLGVFVGVYIYCLLILRTLSNGDGSDNFVFPLSVLGGLALAVVSVGFFIFFIHHISSSIQTSDIVAAITRETLEVIDKIFPDTCADNEDEVVPDMVQQLDWQLIALREVGYIQTVDMSSLLGLAKDHGCVLKMDRGVGDFVAPSLPMLSFAGKENFDKEISDVVGKFYVLDTFRTIEQDPSFGIRQLVDIALKALSPGINDTTTAGTCVEHLSVILMYVASRRMP